MVSISQETESETEARLLRVITRSRLDIFDGSYAFLEFGLDEFPAAADKNALALVRDGQVWSQLVPYSGDDAELFRIFCFHFPAGADNSGLSGGSPRALSGYLMPVCLSLADRTAVTAAFSIIGAYRFPLHRT